MSLQPNKKRKGDSISTNSASINSTNTNRVTSTSSVCVDSQKEKYSERGGETSNCADEDNSEEESINSEEDEEDEESDEDGDEIDGEIDLQDLARQFYLYALEQYEECTISGLVNAFKAVEKSRSIVLEANEELATLLTKSLKRKLSDGKVPPGSSAVQRSLLDDRYLLCLCAVLSAKVMLIDDSRVEGGTNSSNSNNGNSIVKKLTEALVWFPRSIEANLLLAEEYRSNSVEVAHQQEAERLFLKALETGEYLMKTNKRKALKIGKSEVSEDDGLREELIDNEFIAYKKAKECFSLLLYQNSRDKQADELLLVDGFTHRLSSYVFNYPMEKDTLPRSEDAVDSSKHLQVVDNVLNTNSINHLSKVFRPNSPFWLEHNYDITSNASRSVGYFSYLYPLTGRKASNSIEQIIDAIYPLVTEKFPIAKSATIAEWWVHSRPHVNGHQLHFDSDETRIEARKSAAHPLVSVVLFVTSAVGGPTLVTNQTIMDKQLATKGWLAYPKTNRLVMFDAQYLHGVIPGKGLNPFPQRPLPDNNASVFQECSNTRRLTFMVGFWDKISATPRGTDCPGPGQPFPIVEDTKYTWPAEMAIDSSIQYNLDKTLTPVEPQQIPKVWENMTASMASQAPSYQECFQGF